MKTYEEMARDALEKIHAYEDEQVARKRSVRRVAVPAMMFCLVVLLGLGVWKSGILSKKNVPIIDEELGTQNEGNEPVPYPDPVTEEGGKEEGQSGQIQEPDGSDDQIREGAPYPYPGKVEDPNPEYTAPEPEPVTEPEPEPEPSVVHGPAIGGEDPEPIVVPEAMVEDYSKAPDACYATPKRGEVGISVPLKAAMDEYTTPNITYRVVIDVFDGEVIIRDKDRLLEEADRLFGYGYTCAVETLTDNDWSITILTIHATEDQIRNFKGRSDLGYFMFLYQEYYRMNDIAINGTYPSQTVINGGAG